MSPLCCLCPTSYVILACDAVSQNERLRCRIFGTLADISRSSAPGTAARQARCAVISTAVARLVQAAILHGDEKDLYVRRPPPICRLGAGIASYLSGCTTTSSATQRLQLWMPSQLKQAKLSAPSPLGCCTKPQGTRSNLQWTLSVPSPRRDCIPLACGVGQPLCLIGLQAMTGDNNTAVPTTTSKLSRQSARLTHERNMQTNVAFHLGREGPR